MKITKLRLLQIIREEIIRETGIISAPFPLSMQKGVDWFLRNLRHEVEEGKSGRWNLPFDKYVDERMGDWDFWGRIGDPYGTAAEAQGEAAWEFVTRTLAADAGLAKRHEENRKG